MEDEIEEMRKAQNLSFSKMIKMCNRLRTGRIESCLKFEKLVVAATGQRLLLGD